MDIGLAGLLAIPLIDKKARIRISAADGFKVEFVSMSHTFDLFPLCLGTANYGTEPDEAVAFVMLDRFLKAGGNQLDTARVYSDWIPGETGRSESLIGRWLKSRGCRERMVIATKGGHPPMDNMNQVRMSKAELIYDLDLSRKALGVDMIDLYWLHRDDINQPVGQLLEVLESFREKGWIAAYGGSNFSTVRLEAAWRFAQEQGIPGFVGSQPMACLGVQHRKPLEIPLLEKLDAEGQAFLERTGMMLFPYSSQANGYYEKVARWGVDSETLNSHPFNTPENNTIAAQLIALSDESGYSVSSLTLAWWRTKPYTAYPIIGCRTPEQLEDSLGSLAVDESTLQALASIE